MIDVIMLTIDKANEDLLLNCLPVLEKIKNLWKWIST